MASRVAFVPMLTALTVAFGTTSPFSFLTTPVMMPVFAVCASTADGVIKANATMIAASAEAVFCFKLKFFICGLLSKLFSKIKRHERHPCGLRSGRRRPHKTRHNK